MKYHKEIGLVLAVIIVVFASMYLHRDDESFYQETNSDSIDNLKVSSVTVDNRVTFNVVVADTPSKKSSGLSGYKSLEDDQGMLFPYISEPSTTQYFWMKAMLIPIDIIWIKNNAIIHINHEVQPEPNTPDNYLKRYSSEVPVDYVLEVQSGLSDGNNFKIGDSVIVNLQ